MTAVATVSNMASMKFKPWPKPSKLEPSSQLMYELGITARVAHAVMQRSKEQLIDMFEELDFKSACELFAALQTTGEALESLAGMVKAAELRVLVAATAHLQSPDHDAA